MKSRGSARMLVAVLTALLGACGDDEEADRRARATAPPNVPTPASSAEPPQTQVSQAKPAEPAIAEPAPSEAEPPEPTSFRKRVLSAMAGVLGRAPQTRQDAINATYMSIGWQPGNAPTERQNRKAYHFAMEWGFTLGRMSRAGRDEPLRDDDISDAPLDEDALRARGEAHAREARPDRTDEQPAATGERRPRVAEGAPAPATPAPVVPPQSADELGIQRRQRIDALTERMSSLSRTARDLEQKVTSLEQEAKGPFYSEKWRAALTDRSKRLQQIADDAASLAKHLEQAIDNAEGAQ